jgi:hypothetical protein
VEWFESRWRYQGGIVTTLKRWALGGVLMLLGAGCAFGAPVAQTAAVAGAKIEQLTPRGNDFVNSAGKAVRFWGVNMPALYPTEEQSEKLAANLESLQINLARPHHLLRVSKDWNPDMVSGCLMTYKGDSRTPDPEAWERFDGLNAALKQHGIYLALPIDTSRKYLPGDVDILKTTDEDRTEWMAAMKELNGWDWKKQRDVVKALPVIDERAALVEEEFAKRLLTHVNPHTGVAYGKDPQVVSMEVVNEASTEYALICGNKFPDYWQKRLLAKWAAFAQENHVEPGDLYKPKTVDQKRVRAAFFQKLDEDYFKRMEKVIRGTGCQASIIYSNLWHGDHAAEWQSKLAGHVEDHLYCDPEIVKTAADGFYMKSQTLLANKPYIIGELNISEDASKMAERGPYRTMLQVAAAAYGDFNDWSGVVWFAWTHGGQHLGADGWSTVESRDVSVGEMMSDAMVTDHLRTTGMIFRRGLVAESSKPVTWYVDDPVWAADYNGLMRGKSSFKPGWQEIHEIRKAYGAVPAEQAKSPWMTQDPGEVLTSDTGQIQKDMKRKQLTVAAPQAEAFSGFVDGAAPHGLKHLKLAAEAGDFATVIAVVDEGTDWGHAKKLVISRTCIGADKKEVDGPKVGLVGLRAGGAEGAGSTWQFRVTRPRAAAGGKAGEWQVLKANAAEELNLPATEWYECELEMR